VKRGEVPWPEVESWMTRLATETDEASTVSPLPAEPDRARVEDFLIRVRRASALQPDPYDEGVQGVVGTRGVRQG
jgi:hypothetical protein